MNPAEVPAVSVPEAALPYQEPQDLARLNHLAGLLLHRGDVDGAIAALQTALVLDPGSAATAVNLGVALKAAGRLQEAVAALRRAVALAPAEAAAHYNLAGALQALGRPIQAEVACRTALTLQPEWAEAHNRLGGLLQQRGRLNEAREAFGQALAGRTNWFLPHHNLGQIAMQNGEVDGAIGHFRESIRREPSFAQSHLDLGALLLSTGQLAEGWCEFEWRFGGNSPQRPGYDTPVWDGSLLDGETVMVWTEQGLGDHIQFSRYATAIRDCGGRVWLQMPRPLFRLCESLEGVELLVGTDQEPAGFDLQIPVMSLPRVLGTTLDRIPARVPYLYPPPCDHPALLELAGAEQRDFRIGIVWASSPGNPAAAQRDCDISHFGRLAGVAGVSLFSFQFGDRSRDVVGHPEFGIHDLSDFIGDFATTAAFVLEMNLIITVDTAMAHLAGALGWPVWTLLCQPADWRWLTGRSDSPWYPTMHLFRQPSPGDWGSVLASVEQALRKEISDR